MPKLKPHFSLLLAAGLLSACAVGPDYRAPALAATGPFIGQAALDRREAASALDKAELKNWWTGFHDPLLARLVGLALDQNLDIAQAAARVGQARALVRGADAALLPSGDLTAQAARAHQSVETPLGQVLNATPGFDRDGNAYEADIGASWEIDLFGGLRRGREAARADYQASEAGLVATRLAVAAQTADTYVLVRGLQARLAVAVEQAGTSRRLVDTIGLQYQRGVAAELQLRQAEGALAQVESAVPQLEANLDAAMNALDVLLGAQPGTWRAELAAAAPVPAAPGFADTVTPAELLRRRPDLIVAERKLAASTARIGVATAEYYPKLSLSALLGSATTASGDLFRSGANQAQGVLGLRWRLFDFGRVDAQIAAAEGASAEALAAYRQSALRASQDVEDAFSALVRREQQARLLARGESSLARARTASEAAYKGGVVSLIEVLDADNRLLQTRDALVQAQTESARAAIAAFRALGGGWDGGDAAPVRLAAGG